MSINFQRLINIAMTKPQKRHNHFTFILRKSKIVSIGTNHNCTHPRSLAYSYGRPVGVHAELDAVLRLGPGDYSRYSMVNVRLNKHGQIQLSAPCSGCLDMIQQLGFKRVYYSTPVGFEEL